jgi:UDP-GlcNAc:undecaprenyl-phosphate GlcNAc-1-phosphate transferase
MSLLLSFLIAFGSCLMLVPITIKLAKKFGAVDDPKKRRHPALLHNKITPRAGGVPIFIAFAVSALIFAGFSKELIGILLGGAILILTGVLDDKYDLKTPYKFVAQVLAVLIVVAFGVGISFITNPFNIIGGMGLGEVIRLDSLRIVFHIFGTHSIYVWADLFALFWIVWVINMVNFSAGVDGQLGGIAFIALFVIFAVSLRFSISDPSQITISKLAISGMGATLGFLMFNFAPAKIFPGDSASYFLGFLIAVLSILSGAKVGASILVMAIPLIDGGFTVIRRIAEGKSPFSGDRKHLHHRLLELGWSTRKVALFYWILCAILGATALVLPSAGKLFAGVVIGIIVLGGLLWLNTNLQIKDRG